MSFCSQDTSAACTLTHGDRFPQRYEGEIEANVSDARIRAKDGPQTDQHRRKHYRFLVQLERERKQIQQRGVDLERIQEQRPEVIEHLGEEVPKQPNIRLQAAAVDTV